MSTKLTIQEIDRLARLATGSNPELYPAFPPVAVGTLALFDADGKKILIGQEDFTPEGRLKGTKVEGVAPVGSEQETILVPLIRTANFTAKVGRIYHTLGTLTVTDPSPETMTVAGSGSPAAHGVYLRTGDLNSKPIYGQGDYVMDWTGSQWEIRDDNLGETYFTSTQDVLTPDLVTAWAVGPDGTGPTPTVTRTGDVLLTGQSYHVFVATGTATIGGVATGDSRFPVTRTWDGGNWISLSNTLRGDVVMSGSNITAPNQTAAGEHNLMSRRLVDARAGAAANLFGTSGQYVFPVALTEMSSHTGTGGAVDTNRGRRRLYTTTTLDSSTLLSMEFIPRNSSNLSSLSNHTGMSVVMTNISFEGHTFGVFLGGLAASPTLVAMAPLAADGVSLQLRRNGANHEVRWVTKNGGTEVTGSWVSIGAVAVPLQVLISANAGTAQGRIRALDATISSAWLWSGSVSGLPAVGGQYCGVGQVTTANPAASANITAIWAVHAFQGLILP